MSRPRSRAMVALALTLTATSHFNLRCFVQPSARYPTRPAGCSHVCYAFLGAESLVAAINNGFTAVENANKVLQFGDLLQNWSSVMPGAKLKLEVDKSSEAEVLKHVEKLCKEIAHEVDNNKTISVLGMSQQRQVTLGTRVVDGTPFQKLMTKVLAVNRSGCTAVHAEPGVGKSIASLRALPAGRVSKNYTVLLDGGFRAEMMRFFRVTSFDLVVGVARLVFPALTQAGVCMNMIFDNGVEEDEDFHKSRTEWISLLKAAYESGHHLIVVTQSEALAMKIGSLNGERSRASAEQEAPVKYRWAKEQAREYLGYLLEARNIQPEAVDVDKLLSSCSIPDVYGGWKPIAMSNYLDFNETPVVLSSAAPQPISAVWVCQLGSPDGKDFEIVGNAFKITASVSDVDDLKKAIKQEKPNRVICDADEIDIYSKEDGRWVKEAKMSASLRDTDEADCYGFMQCWGTTFHLVQ
ncbi:unnamed protein product [Effrenium voratum]|nr:unnamed protein product [Effrenium voratum]